ncbi:MAG: tetratricopeptide repeat protein [Bacteroidales bacterium]
MVKLKKEKEETTAAVPTVDSALTRTERFIEENQKTLTYVVLGILILVGGYMGYHRFMLAPKETEAQKAIYQAENYFARDSFRLALDGDGTNLGFTNIIEDYSITKTAGLASYYAGICYLNLGEYESAIEYLKKYKGDDEIIRPLAFGAMGDAYAELGANEDAANSYMKAARASENAFTAPMFLLKAGQVYEELKDFDAALKAYERIKKDFSKSSEGASIDKYIGRARVLAGK